MFKKSLITFFGIFGILLVLLNIAHAISEVQNLNQNQIGYNSLSKFNINHRQTDKELIIEIKGNFQKDVDALIDEGKLIIRYKDNNGNTLEESYALPVLVNENGIKTEIKENIITITAPILAQTEKNKNLVKTKIDRMKKWHALDKDLDSLFDFDSLFENDDIFGMSFFEKEMERINKQMRQMAKMHENLMKQMSTRGFNTNLSSSCKVSHKIEGDNVIVTIEGNRLDNLEFKVEDNMFKLYNKITQLNQESSENQISSFNFQSSFAQSFTLPAKVNASKMRVNRLNNKIIVTLPIVK